MIKRIMDLTEFDKRCFFADLTRANVYSIIELVDLKQEKMKIDEKTDVQTPEGE